MTVDYKDWKAAQPAPAGPFGLTPAQWAEGKRLTRLAIVQLDDLVAGDTWAVYRRSIEALLEQDKAGLIMLTEEILAPTTVGDRLLTCKLAAATLAGRIAARA